MNEKIVIAVFAGFVSLIVSIISAYISYRKINYDFKLKEKEISHIYIEKLYDMRLVSYEEAFNLTEDLGKRRGKSNEEVAIVIEDGLNNIVEWKKGTASLILSDDSLKAYYVLYDCLKVNPESEFNYSDKQIDKIWHARNSFRRKLRSEIII